MNISEIKYNKLKEQINELIKLKDRVIDYTLGISDYKLYKEIEEINRKEIEGLKNKLETQKQNNNVEIKANDIKKITDELDKYDMIKYFETKEDFDLFKEFKKGINEIKNYNEFVNVLNITPITQIPFSNKNSQIDKMEAYINKVNSEIKNYNKDDYSKNLNIVKQGQTALKEYIKVKEEIEKVDVYKYNEQKYMNNFLKLNNIDKDTLRELNEEFKNILNDIPKEYNEEKIKELISENIIGMSTLTFDLNKSFTETMYDENKNYYEEVKDLIKEQMPIEEFETLGTINNEKVDFINEEINKCFLLGEKLNLFNEYINLNELIENPTIKIDKNDFLILDNNDGIIDKINNIIDELENNPIESENNMIDKKNTKHIF